MSKVAGCCRDTSYLIQIIACVPGEAVVKFNSLGLEVNADDGPVLAGNKVDWHDQLAQVRHPDSLRGSLRQSGDILTPTGDAPYTNGKHIQRLPGPGDGWRRGSRRRTTCGCHISKRPGA